MRNIFILFFGFILFSGCVSNASKENLAKSDYKMIENNVSKVEIKKTNGKYQLFVNNEPFYINGAGLEFGDISALAKHNGNSFRTWRTENGQRSGKEVLDEAHKNGLKVAMGIEVARERHGFDYNDVAAVKEQHESIKKEVLALKDHPALLLWVIGNELNLRYTNTKVWDAVNELSKMIHEVDSNHLTTTTLAGINKKEIDLIKEKCTDLDVLSLQTYGDLPNLPRKVKEYGWTGPYIVSEWGATGHWEVPKTKWGAPIEDHSSLKASKYLQRYQQGIALDTIQCIGSYVFLWGQKQERTPTWYGMFLEDKKETESVDVMHYIWNNEWPANKTPQILSYTLNKKTAYQSIVVEPNIELTANINIVDFEDDGINYKWEILRESTDLRDGGDKEERPEKIDVQVVNKDKGELKFRSPKKGIYRLFVYADDGFGHAAAANIPFKVK